MTTSKYVHPDDEGRVHLRGPDGIDTLMVGLDRMHFYRLTGATPENATDEQVERYFAQKAKEAETGKPVTDVLSSESAANMVTRELGIVNFQQVIDNNDAIAGLSDDAFPSAPPSLPRQPQQTQPLPPSAESSQTSSGSSLGSPPRYQPSGAGLPPPPRYQPSSDVTDQPTNQQSESGVTEPVSQFLRRENEILYLQAPDGTEQRVTQYVRVHFQRMLEKDLVEATDEDIEMWWKLQGSLDAGSSLSEAQSQNLLTEALKAAGKLKRGELETLHQAVSAWLEARRDVGNERQP